MDGVPALRDGMPAPKLRTSLHRGENSERVERIDKVCGPSRIDEKDQQHSRDEPDDAPTVKLLHPGSEHEDDVSGPDEPDELDELGASDSEIIRAWADRVEFHARSLAARGERPAGIRDQHTHTNRDSPYETSTVSAASAIMGEWNCPSRTKAQRR